MSGLLPVSASREPVLRGSASAFKVSHSTVREIRSSLYSIIVPASSRVLVRGARCVPEIRDHERPAAQPFMSTSAGGITCTTTLGRCDIPDRCSTWPAMSPPADWPAQYTLINDGPQDRRLVLSQDRLPLDAGRHHFIDFLVGDLDPGAEYRPRVVSGLQQPGHQRVARTSAATSPPAPPRQSRNQAGNGAARRCSCIRSNVPGVPNTSSRRRANSRVGTRAMVSTRLTRLPL